MSSNVDMPKLTPKQSIEYQLYLCEHHLCTNCQFLFIEKGTAYCRLRVETNKHKVKK